MLKHLCRFVAVLCFTVPTVAFSIDPESTSSSNLKQFIELYNETGLKHFHKFTHIPITLKNYPDEIARAGVTVISHDLQLTEETIAPLQKLYNEGDFEGLYAAWLELIYRDEQGRPYARLSNLNDGHWTVKHQALVLDVPGLISVKLKNPIRLDKFSVIDEKNLFDSAPEYMSLGLAKTLTLFVAVDRFSELFHAGDYLFYRYKESISISPTFNKMLADSRKKYVRTTLGNEAMLVAMVFDYEIIPVTSDFLPVLVDRYLNKNSLANEKIAERRNLALRGTREP